MRFFQVESPDTEPAVIIAANFDHAADIYSVVTATQLGFLPDASFSVREWCPPQSEQYASLWEACRPGLSGVASCNEGVWIIEPV